MPSIGEITAALWIGFLFTLQGVSRADSVELQPCADQAYGPGALCGSVTVAEDRDQLDGRSLALHLVVLPAVGGEPTEPVFLLAGGPGQGATDLVGLALGPFAPVRQSRDIVLVDQRGTGQSNRIDCPVDAAESPQDVFGRLFDPAGVRTCLTAVKERADPTLYTTDHVIDDLEQVRRELGYARILLWGGSGGTRTALVWMRRYPDSIAGALLDGVTPTHFRAPSTFAPGCQEALEKVFAECHLQSDCDSAFPELEAEFRSLLELFDAGPVPTHVVSQEGEEIRVDLHRGDFTYAVRGILYRSGSLARLPAMIHRAVTTRDLHPFAQAYWERQVGIRPLVAMGVHFAVYCSEDLPFLAADVEASTRGTFVGRYLIEQYRGVCEEWEASPVDPSFLEPIESSIPVLIFSGYYDPSTPASLGDEVAATLPNSRHIVVRNESHGAEFGCGRQAAVRFLTTGSLEGLGPICEDVGPVRYEVSP